MTLKRWLVGVLTLALIAGFSLPLAAQQQTGAITGRAIDAQGGALPGVTVSIASPNLIGGAYAVTDEQGVYRFTLPGGIYTVTFNLTTSESQYRRDQPRRRRHCHVNGGSKSGRCRRASR
jgi:hypothetical protein